MKLPKGKLLTLLAIFAAVGLVTATGAFTTVTAERTANVGVAGDNNALLKIDAVSSSSNSGSGTTPAAGSNPYFEVPGDGTGQLKLEKLNLEAQTSVDNVFMIENQGTQAVSVWITASDGSDSETGNPNAIEFGVLPEMGSTYHLEDTSGNDVTSGNIAVGDDSPVSVRGSGSAVELEPGEKIIVGVYIDTSDNTPLDGINPGASSGVAKGEDIIDTMTIHADADQSASYQVGEDSSS